MNLTPPQSAAGRSFLSPGVTVVVHEELDLDAVVVTNAATGRRVTEADMEAEAREFDRMRGLIPGGKSLSGDGSHSAALRPWLERRRNPAYRPTLPPQLSDCH